jgi:hypothetical protein
MAVVRGRSRKNTELTYYKCSNTESSNRNIITNFVRSPLITPMWMGTSLGCCSATDSPAGQRDQDFCTTQTYLLPRERRRFHETPTSADKGGPTNLRLGLGVAIAGCVEVACSSYRYVMTIQSERASGSARYDAYLNNSRLRPSSIQPPQ